MARLVTYKCTSTVKSLGIDPCWALCRSRHWIPQSVKLPVNTMGTCHLRIDSLSICPVDEKADHWDLLQLLFLFYFLVSLLDWRSSENHLYFLFLLFIILIEVEESTDNHVWLEIVNFDNQNYRPSQGFCLKTFHDCHVCIKTVMEKRQTNRNNNFYIPWLHGFTTQLHWLWNIDNSCLIFGNHKLYTNNLSSSRFGFIHSKMWTILMTS